MNSITIIIVLLSVIMGLASGSWLVGLSIFAGLIILERNKRTVTAAQERISAHLLDR